MRSLYESILDSDGEIKNDISLKTDRHKQRYAVMNIFKKHFAVKSIISGKVCSIKRSNYGIIKEFVEDLKKLPFIENAYMDGTREEPCIDPHMSCIVTAYDVKGFDFHFSFNKVQNCVLYIVDTSDYQCKLTDYLKN